METKSNSENNKNQKTVANYFLIKYKSEETRKKFAEYVLQIIKKHEIRDFHVEEKYAFEEERIMYNMRTIGSGKFSFELLEYQFLKYYSY